MPLFLLRFYKLKKKLYYIKTTTFALGCWKFNASKKVKKEDYQNKQQRK